MKSDRNTCDSTEFNEEAITNLKEAIRYFRAREGNFSSQDTLITILIKLDSNTINLHDFSKDEISSLLIVINENIEFMDKYDGYKFLPDAQARSLKQKIILPLYEYKKALIQLR